MSNAQFRRKVQRGNGNCMAFERDGRRYIGDKVGANLRRLPVSIELSQKIASKNDTDFFMDIKKRLDVAQLKNNQELHLSTTG